MSSRKLTVEGISATAVHEAAHVVAHVRDGYGVFRYVTLRPRDKRHAGHMYGGKRVHTMAVMAGPLAELMYDGLRFDSPGALWAHMYDNGGCSDLEIVHAECEDAAEIVYWLGEVVGLLDKHWGEIILIAGMLERRRTLTSREVRDFLDVIEKGMV